MPSDDVTPSSSPPPPDNVQTNEIENGKDNLKHEDKQNWENLPLNDVDYRYQGGPRLTYLWCQDDLDHREELSGQTLYLGANVGVDGNIYCIPGHASHVLQVNTSTDCVTRVGPPLLIGTKYKWLRGVRVGDVIYGLPCHADCVLKIHVPTLTISMLAIAYAGDEVERAVEWKYHGGSVSPLDGCIYAIPQSAGRVLKINPKTEVCCLVGPHFPGRYKWYGGIIGKTDGAIYGIPHSFDHVLRILPDEITLHGDFGHFGTHKWHGASATRDGSIVCVPANADDVLVITPAPSRDLPPVLTIASDHDVVKTGQHRSDSKYKYLGAMIGTDGKVYCFPSGSEHVLQVETEIVDPSCNTTVRLRNVGPNLYDMERLHQNKWQNGVKHDNEQSVYAIPLAAESVLRITCESEPQVTTWKLPFPHRGLGKWEGGVLHPPSGVIYCVPNNHKAVLRIEPPGRLLAQPQGVTNDVSVTVNPDDGSQTHPKSSVEEPKRNGFQRNEDSVGGPERSWVDASPLSGQTIYRSGIATLRSSAHRVKFSPNFRKHDPQPRDESGRETKTTCLPPSICQTKVFPYDREKYNLTGALIRLLQRCEPNIVGSFRSDESAMQQPRLEDFVVPISSVWRTVNGGQCESAQKYLSDVVAGDEVFLEAFDRVVCEVVLPHLKRELEDIGAAYSRQINGGPSTVTFYYQRPPTLRLQPGPAWALVKAHNDAEYGHQNGELNFWIPLTDRTITQVDLYCESQFDKGDYNPVAAAIGEIISFHGSSCRHYVNSNNTPFTRVSLDFRVGVQGYFDPVWQMKGTTDDHGRKKVQI